MADALLFAGYLAEQKVLQLEVQRNDGTVAVAVVPLPDGRRLLAVERTYREGVRLIYDPTEEELEIARAGNIWDLWNSGRGEMF
ncbi:MAG: hypothetical protein HC897_00350 [Thermoanaerobaculia bacterium]|nr:hypothetical protein [Thermoanaerobaculia bacterium]